RSWRLYLLAPQYAQSLSTVLRGTAALGPHLSVQAFAQLFTEGVAYGDVLRAVVGPGRSTVQVEGLARATPADVPAYPDQRAPDGPAPAPCRAAARAPSSSRCSAARGSPSAPPRRRRSASPSPRGCAIPACRDRPGTPSSTPGSPQQGCRGASGRARAACQ